MTQQITMVMVCRGVIPTGLEHAQVMYPLAGEHQRGVEHAQPGQHPHQDRQP